MPSTCLMLHLAPKGNYVDTQHPWTREYLLLSKMAAPRQREKTNVLMMGQAKLR